MGGKGTARSNGNSRCSSRRTMALPHSIVRMSTTNAGALRTMSHSLVPLPLARGHIFSEPARPVPAPTVSTSSARLPLLFWQLFSFLYDFSDTSMARIVQSSVEIESNGSRFVVGKSSNNRWQIVRETKEISNTTRRSLSMRQGV